MLVDSHCHLHCIDLEPFDNNLDHVITAAEEAGITHFLNVCVSLEDYPKLKNIADRYPQVSMSVGVHPNEDTAINAQTLCDLAQHPSCIAIGETGLDYYRTAAENRAIQTNNFREHIRAALTTQKPLIIHTREAASDTIQILREENARDIGGVMHCFSEDWDIAQQAMDLNFYISFSGIVTFKNATVLQSVARQMPLDKILIETDSPWLAPVPFRGKQNHPALVKYVAEFLADLKEVDFETIAHVTTDNFYRCFRVANDSLRSKEQSSSGIF